MNSEKIEIKEAVIVEGKYDKIKLQSFISSPIIETNGFRIFKDKEKQSLIRNIADTRGILIITDSDSAGFMIRNFLKGFVPDDKIKHAYIPNIKGKEKRKEEPSKEGFLGVEGIEISLISEVIEKSGATIIGHNDDKEKSVEITKADFFELGLSGKENSDIKRKQVLSSLSLPEYLNTNAMITAVNCLFTKDEFVKFVESIN